MKAVFLAAIAVCAGLGFGLGAASARDFSQGSQAKSWGLTGEAKATFSARVVDVLCELAGDCPPDCGAGARQLGLERQADGKLILPMKNGQPLFTGAAQELAPYCGQVIDVDGLMVGGADVYDGAPTFYQVQLLRPPGGDWMKANRWTRVWADANPEAAGKSGPWFRKDPRIESRIEREGYLGLGQEADKQFILDWY